MDIIARLKAKDEDAYEELVQKYKNTFFYMSKQFLKNRNDCEDCVQEIFLKIFSKINQFNSNEGNLNAWIIQLAKNHIIDCYRSVEKRNERFVLNEEIVEVMPEEDSNSPFEGILEELRMYLTQEEYDLLIYRVVSGLTFSQIATVMDKEVYTVRRKFKDVYQRSRAFVKRKGYLNDKEM